MKYIGTLVDVCIAKGYITQDQAPWLYYGIEKRVTTILVSVPMLIIGTLVSTPAMSIAFYISFCSLRTRTNGLHAKTLAGCLILSIISEIFFLGILPCILDDTVTISLLIVSTISIAVLAPYNHPNMALSAEESMACAKSAKKRLLILILLLIILYVMRLKQFVNSMAKSIGSVTFRHLKGSFPKLPFKSLSRKKFMVPLISYL